ncbi:Helix-turn-helix [Gemella morbillorum]|uniref:helix-turn-helix domain-containing protein n=1 Tax=Gemella morbillorum TaxID=29391 RepID=UPI000DA2ADC2|nr:helix-turn-helix transcriptional regulator [Gemella morbillorum]UBH81398.1 helix-turn-helix domain-containing protein [Gemella morbillorum]SQH55167.1 Helix-turn-helix [Gemella morbillorum]
MSNLGNKKTMSNNLKRYLRINKVSRTQLSESLGISYSTISDWVNGKSYPRIDKIEMMANYFGINKSDLVEDKANQKEIDIANMVNDLMDNLNSNQALMYSGEPMDEVTKELVRASIEQAARIAMARHKTENDN